MSHRLTVSAGQQVLLPREGHLFMKRFRFAVSTVVVGTMLATQAIAAEAPAVDPAIVEVLEKAEALIRHSDFLSYHLEWSLEHPKFKDGRFEASGTCWLKKVATDSLFGAHFHVKGVGEFGPFDYFYDGTDGREVRHQEKKVLIFRVAGSPQDARHPARNRLGAMMFNGLLVDSEFKTTVLENLASASMEESPDGSRWIITTKSVPDPFSFETSRVLEIDKTSYRIDRIRQATSNIKLESSIVGDYVFTQHQRGEAQVAPHILMPEDFEPRYKRKRSR